MTGAPRVTVVRRRHAAMPYSFDACMALSIFGQL